jgi:RhtB (resistance to homoserine/threonine) family protein
MFDLQLATFIVLAAALTLSPGADTLLVIRNVVARGRSAGIATAFGICCGLFVHATLSALGLSVLLAHSAWAYELLKISGALYLLWLGLQSLAQVLRRSGAGDGIVAIPAATPSLRGRSFREGLLTNVLNPKVAVFYLAFLPQFIAVHDPVFAKSMLLAGIHAAMGLAWLVALAAALDRARALVTRPRVKQLLGGVSGAILIGLGARLVLARNA